MAANQTKVKLNDIISEAVEKMVEAREGEGEQRRKTQKEKRLAEGVKKALLEGDKRSHPTPVSLLTANKYLTKVRDAISELGYKHHGFPAAVTRLGKQFPEYQESLLMLVDLPLKTAAQALRKWQAELMEQMETLGKSAEGKKVRDFFNKLSAIDVVPVAISAMAFDAAERQFIKDHREEMIVKKQSKLITLQMSEVIELIGNLLTTSVSDPKRTEKMALGISLATGRRQIETCIQGRFEKAGDYEMTFTGQAKARGDMREVTIPTLAPVDSILDALETIRNSRRMEEIREYMVEKSFYTENEMFNNKSRSFTATAEKVLGEAFGAKPDQQTWMFKDSRAIYAKTAYEMYKAETLAKGEQISSEDIFFTNRLGHNDAKAKENYKVFEVIPDEVTRVETSQLVERTPEQRLEGLRGLLNSESIQQNRLEPNLARVIEFVEREPNQHITKIWLRKEVKGGKTIRLNLLHEIIEKAGLELV